MQLPPYAWRTIWGKLGRKPIIKRGKAPHSLLDVYHLWFTVEQAENDLLAMGFRKVNQTLFEKGE